jgi:hypothetical protein
LTTGLLAILASARISSRSSGRYEHRDRLIDL